MKKYLNEFSETSLYKNKLISILLIGSVIIASIFIAIATADSPAMVLLAIGIAGVLGLRKNHSKRIPINKDLIRFYFKNSDFYEPVFKRIYRKIKGISYEEKYWAGAGW